ncbi:response regulator transcription factor [Paraburkholderia sp. GAS32]|uniref:response regulator transcription factor n=1 Tax=Paraburkholderia sp. GAS32 TaxID=3035129 RepID=UPI003D1A7AA9
MKPLILVVDDDAVSRHALRVGLQSSGYDVSVLYSPAKVLRRVERERPSLILMSSATTGSGCALTVLNALRAVGDEVPVIMLGDVDDVTERIVALDCGADDYMRAPLNVREVLVRVRAVLRRAAQADLRAPAAIKPFDFGGFRLDFLSRTLTFRGRYVPLSQSEFAMLRLFVTMPGRVLSKMTLGQAVCSELPGGSTSVEVLVHRLRTRLERAAGQPAVIRTVRGRGYVFGPLK